MIPIAGAGRSPSARAGIGHALWQQHAAQLVKLDNFGKIGRFVLHSDSRLLYLRLFLSAREGVEDSGRQVERWRIQRIRSGFRARQDRSSWKT
jgi:hypothetical protein